jgi:hypothetical protein
MSLGVAVLGAPPSICPRTHPYAYRDGEFCCARPFEAFDDDDDGFDGRYIDKTRSTCCEYQEHEKCGKKGETCETCEYTLNYNAHVLNLCLR